MINVFKSRTNWVLFISVCVSVLQASQPFLTPELFALLQTILGALGVYFRTYPKQHVG
jgi:hypothetical protein